MPGLHRISHRGIEGPPTLAVEIPSPPTRTIDRVTERRLYARHGVPYLWLVDPEARAIEAFALQDDRDAWDRDAWGVWGAISGPPILI
jgi:Uma2 family endonuclease